MKIAIIGYGKMGHIIEQTALQRGHEIVCRIDKENLQDFDSEAFAGADVAIEFSTPGTAFDNIRRAMQRGISVVSGTTGWTDRLPQLQQEAGQLKVGLFWTSNFSIGVNIFFEINRQLAELMNRFGQYSPSMREVHHIHKLDAPSGTAISLANDIIQRVDRTERWQLGTESAPGCLPIEAIRDGEVPGTHEVCYDSAVDSICIRHEAKSREGFALGAVMAAEFIKGRQGFYSMSDLLGF